MKLHHLTICKPKLAESYDQAEIDRIREIMSGYQPQDYSIGKNDQGQTVVNMYKSLIIPASWTSFPIRFHYIGGNVVMSSHSKLTSLVGGPTKVEHCMYVNGGNLESLVGLPEVANKLSFAGGVKSLKGIHKANPNMKISAEVFVSPEVTNILGLAMIPGVNTVLITGNSAKFDVSHHDPHQFQEQLIDAGLEQQARL